MIRTRTFAAVLTLVFAAACAAPQKKEEVKVSPTEKPEQKLDEAAEAWRSQPPPAGEAPELVTPEFKKETLPNGLTVYVSERHDLPVVSIAVAFAAGSAQDPKGKAGVADLTMKTMLEGAGTRDAIALEEAFADLGASPYSMAQPDGAMVGTTVLSRNAPAAMQLVADIVLRPTLKPEDFKRKQREHLNTLARQAGSPGFLMQVAFTEAAYGRQHPYGTLTSGLPSTVEGITAADVKGFYTKNFGPKAAALIVTGDVTMEQAKQWAQTYFGNWKGAAVRPPVPPKVPTEVKELVLVPKPGLNQTLIAMGRPAIPAGHPDQAALELASSVFGGTFGSRLNMNLREAKGYSYGAHAYVSPRRGPGPLMAYSSVKADATGPAVQEFLNELHGLKQRPINELELTAAREGLIRSLPGTFNSVEDLTSAAAGLYWEERPLDFYQQYVNQLEGASLEQVQAAAVKYFDPAKLDVVLVGDPDLVQIQLQPLNLGKVTMVQPPQTGPAGR